MMEDKILIWRFRRGGREALERIYCKYEAMLLTIAAAILGEPTEAEDVVHDVFMTLAQSPKRIRLNGNLRGFLAVCVTNRARDRLRARRDGMSLEDVEFYVPEGLQPEAMVARQEEMRLVWSGLVRLPEEQHQVVVLHLVAGLRFRQIATTLGISINTAQSRYRYGLEKLRTILNNELKE